LELFLNDIPTLKLLGSPFFVESAIPYDVDNDVQLVCKYLQAYEKNKIDTLYVEKRGRRSDRPVKFGIDPDLPERRCHDLLQNNMPKHITSSKIIQQLFVRYDRSVLKYFTTRFGAGIIWYRNNLVQGYYGQLDMGILGPVCCVFRLLSQFGVRQGISFHPLIFIFLNPCRYMKRRCHFLDHLSAFNYNEGVGELIMKSGKTEETYTKELGSTLMHTMLKEVSDFCDPDIKNNWSLKPHQQVYITWPTNYY
jgi:hypothetical protein